MSFFNAFFSIFCPTSAPSTFSLSLFTSLHLFYINNSSSINSDTSESDIRALQQARTDTLNRITVQISYDPWELLDVLTIASKPYSTDHSFGPFRDGKTPPYLNKPGVPIYDLILIDGLHILFSPYFGIHPFDSRSVSVIGGSSGVGTGTGTGTLTRSGTVTGTGTGVKGVGVLGRSKIRF